MKINTKNRYSKNKGFVVQGVIAVIALLIIIWGAFYFSSKNEAPTDLAVTVTSPNGGSYAVGSTTSMTYNITGEVKPEYHVALIAEPGYVPITVIPASQTTYTWTIPETMCLGGDACMPTQAGEYTIKAELYSEETCVGFCVRNENAKLLAEGRSAAFTIITGTTTATTTTPSTPGALLKVCPDEKIINKMPTTVPNDNPPAEYYILRGERKEIAEFDKTWVETNCTVEEQVVY